MTVIDLYAAAVGACLVLAAFVWVVVSDYMHRYRAIRNQRNRWH